MQACTDREPLYMVYNCTYYGVMIKRVVINCIVSISLCDFMRTLSLKLVLCHGSGAELTHSSMCQKGSTSKTPKFDEFK
jgi:hypothetical protein